MGVVLQGGVGVGIGGDPKCYVATPVICLSDLVQMGKSGSPVAYPNSNLSRVCCTAGEERTASTIDTMSQQKDKPDDVIQQEQVTEDDARFREIKGDVEVEKYAQETADIHVDAAMNKKLFWKVNKRILVVMLGVSSIQQLTRGRSNLL